MAFDLSTQSPLPLRWTATHAPISYTLYEVSACTVGILTQDVLNLRDVLDMEVDGRRVPLQVIDILPSVPSSVGPEIKRYRLSCLDCLMELDRLLLNSEAGSSGLQFARCPLNPRLYVEVRWPGRECLELLESVDISRSGLLLRVAQADDPTRLPRDTAIPLRLDVARLWLPQSLQPLGRIVRAFQAHEDFRTFSYIAVQFIDFSQRESEHWTRFLRRIERGFLSDLSPPA